MCMKTAASGLLARGRIKTAIRGRFEQDGFLEVECGALQVSPGNEAHLHAFATEMIATGGARQTRYLHTSPEFASKKLLAAGERRIFDFARVFRNRERGALHAPEFVMLEWYRANEPYAAVIADCLAILRLAADTTARRRFAFRDRVCDPRAEPERISVVDAFRVHAGIDLFASLSPEGEGDRETLARLAEAAGSMSRPTTTGPTSSARSLWRKSSRSWATAGRRFFSNIPAAKRRWRASRRTIRAWRNDSSFMCAGWSSPTASAN
jgi:elongation factor P--beta-lysine ligase